MCELLTFLWSGRQNVSDSFFFFFFAADETTVLLIRIVSSSLQNMTPNIFLRLSPYHCGTFVLFFWYTHTQVKLEQTRVCVFNSTCVGVCVHIWSVYILTNVGQRRILWILSLTFNSPPRTATGKRSGLRRWRNTDRTRTSVQSIRVEFVGLKHTIDRENKK